MINKKEEMVGLLNGGEVVWKHQSQSDQYNIIDIQGVEHILIKTNKSLDFELTHRVFLFNADDVLKNTSVVIESEDVTFDDFKKIVAGEEPDILIQRKDKLRLAFDNLLTECVC